MADVTAPMREAPSTQSEGKHKERIPGVLKPLEMVGGGVQGEGGPACRWMGCGLQQLLHGHGSTHSYLGTRRAPFRPTSDGTRPLCQTGSRGVPADSAWAGGRAQFCSMQLRSRAGGCIQPRHRVSVNMVLPVFNRVEKGVRVCIHAHMHVPVSVCLCAPLSLLVYRLTHAYAPAYNKRGSFPTE
jgi:hypothetical protein